MARALMVDVDGVLIRQPGRRRWDADLFEDLGIDPVQLQELFFQVHFDDVVLGRADLFDRLDLVLPNIGSATSAQLVEYWFEHDAHLDLDLLTDVAWARQRGLAVHLATVQEHHRARYLWEVLGLRDHFDGMHYAADVGFRKPDPELYEIVVRRTGLTAGEHLLIDDSADNVAAALAAGWEGIVWRPGMRLRSVVGLQR
jgi:putative hydrolase of the HAD superfamily